MSSIGSLLSIRSITTLFAAGIVAAATQSKAQANVGFSGSVSASASFGTGAPAPTPVPVYVAPVPVYVNPTPAPPPTYAATAYYAPVVAAPAPPPEVRHWGIGIRSFGMAMIDSDHNDSTHSANSDDRATALGGGGLFLRYRGVGNLGFELAVDGGVSDRESTEQLGYERSTALATASLLYRFNPESRFDWHLIVGAGVAATEIRYNTYNGINASCGCTTLPDEEYSQTELHGGLGFEYRITPGWALSGDMRFHALSKPDYNESNYVPSEAYEKRDGESALSLNVGIGYYF